MHKVCPQCHSDRVLSDMFLITGHYKCIDCDYEGAFIITMEDAEYQELLDADSRDKESS